MKRVIGQGLIVILAFIFQSTIFAAWSFNGIKPNLLLIIAVFFGFSAGTNQGLLTGFFGGLLCDIFFGTYIGVYAFLFMLCGGLGGIAAKSFYQDEIVFPYMTIMLSDALFGIVCYVAAFLIRGRFAFLSYLQHVLLPEVLYTLLLSLCILPFLRKYNRFFEKWEQKKEKTSDV